MRQKLLMFCVVGALCAGLATLAQGQEKPAPAYKLGAVSAQAFNAVTNQLSPVNEDTSFYNDLDVSLLVSLRVDGQAGSFEAGRRVQITVAEGKKQIVTRTAHLGVFSESGHYFVPVWIYGSLCDNVTVKARLVGQKTPSAITKTFVFHCGE